MNNTRLFRDGEDDRVHQSVNLIFVHVFIALPQPSGIVLVLFNVLSH
jgi:hypothetical protein